MFPIVSNTMVVSFFIHFGRVAAGTVVGPLERGRAGRQARVEWSVLVAAISHAVHDHHGVPEFVALSVPPQMKLSLPPQLKCCP